MRKKAGNWTFMAVLSVILALCAAGLEALAQENKGDSVKILKEIAGDYEFLVEGQMMVINFYMENEKLYGAPVGEASEEIHPVEGKELQFDVTVTDGGYYHLEFVRNEEGKIVKCILKAEGMEYEGIKK